MHGKHLTVLRVNTPFSNFSGVVGRGSKLFMSQTYSKVSVTSAFVVNMLTRELLAVETKNSLV